jgi:hypothetical protein
MAILKVVKPTTLKRDPTKQAIALPADQKYSVQAGTTFPINAWNPAANNHIQVELKQPLNGSTNWFAYADHITVVQETLNPLEAARDREKVFNYFRAIETQEGSNENRLSFLDRGAESSAYFNAIDQFPQRLQQKPDGQTLVSLGSQLQPTGLKQPVSFLPYPKRGTVQTIDQVGLEFLSSDIKEACLCIGSFVNGEMRAHWLGRNPLRNTQFWSATKFVPVLNVVAQANQQAIKTPIKECFFHDPKRTKADVSFTDCAIDIVSYRHDNISQELFISNQMAAMLKRFSTPLQLEKWFSDITGNKQLIFRGTYGDPPFIAAPQLRTANTLLLQASSDAGSGDNSVSAYDLTRLISMLGWHFHISADSKLPAAQWHSLETVVRTMGYDSARYIDAAIKLLGIQDTIRNPVILSKLGFGPSTTRDQTELVYTALLWFIDDRPRTQKKPSVLRTLAMTLRGTVQKRGASGERDLDEEARWLDARMAAEVTEILRRIVTQELA